MTDPLTDPEQPDARFSLANERTFLAWGRTCIALIATGVAVARLLPGRDVVNVWLALALVVAGMALALLSFVQYRRTDAAIRADQPIPASRLPLVLLGVIVLAGAFAVLLSLGP